MILRAYIPTLTQPPVRYDLSAYGAHFETVPSVAFDPDSHVILVYPYLYMAYQPDYFIALLKAEEATIEENDQRDKWEKPKTNIRYTLPSDQCLLFLNPTRNTTLQLTVHDFEIIDDLAIEALFGL